MDSSSLIFLLKTTLVALNPYISVTLPSDESPEEELVLFDPSKPREEPIDVQEIEFDNDPDDVD